MALSKPLAWTAAACLGWWACSPNVPLAAVEDLRPETLFGGAGPAAVVFWAPWAPASVELLPTAAELAEEYADDGVGFATVALVAETADEAPFAPRGFPYTARHYRFGGDPERTLAVFGEIDLPAVVVYDRAGRPAYVLGTVSGEPPAPEDIADAIEAVLAAGPRG